MTTLKDIFSKYGVNTTNNFQLSKWAKDLNIPNFHYAMRDEIKFLPLNKLPLNVIVNIHTSNERGVHHSALHISKDKKVCFFDSYALPPTQEIIDFTKDFKDRKCNTFKFQGFNTSFCGQLCLFILKKLNEGKGFLDILLSLYKK